MKNLSESGSNVGRMQVELYKEIKKNGSSRSLRSAITKFAVICGQIRPQKCRAYIGVFYMQWTKNKGLQH